MTQVQEQSESQRRLEQIERWKRREEEQTAQLLQVLPQLEPPLISVLQEWRPILRLTSRYAADWQQTRPFQSARPEPHTEIQVEWLTSEAVRQTEEWSRQLGVLLQHSRALAADPEASELVRQFIRESQETIGVQFTADPAAPPTFAAIEQYEEENRTIDGDTPSPDKPVNSAEADGEHSRAEEEPPNAPDMNGGAVGTDNHMSDDKPVPIGGHTLPPLPYAYNALEPHIDEKTMRIHHDIHHKSYVDGLNKAEKALEKSRKTGDFDLVKHWERELAFNGAGHYLHTLFWMTMSPVGGGTPPEPLAGQLAWDFGSFKAFQEQFSQAAEKVEGGGWTILVWSPRSGRLEILQAEKHQNLSQWDVIPLLPLDVWEHAYYLKHQNKRADYIKDWWKVVNWPFVNERFEQASKLRWKPY
ncbi:superoxide dismutase [Paenibacillus daejeonensis]|uniref:superoxide dismutase n=1 Tax=Paenibacillus daejeonensis TaxID=135193 RepID=UPI000373E61F|nr:superoxide dismutase [Paenibacillus daejeonensis]